MCWIKVGLCHCCVTGGCSGHLLWLRSCLLRREKETKHSANEKSNCLRSWRKGKCSTLCPMGTSEVWPGFANAAISCHHHSLTLWWSSCKDLQLHREIPFPLYLPWEQVLKSSRNGGILDLAGTILFVIFPQVNVYFYTSVDSTGGLCWWERLLCLPVFPPSFGKGLWKLLGKTTQCLPHKVSSHLEQNRDSLWISENGGSS